MTDFNITKDVFPKIYSLKEACQIEAIARVDERRKFAETLAKVNWEVIKDNVDIPQFILNLAGYEKEMKGGVE